MRVYLCVRVTGEQQGHRGQRRKCLCKGVSGKQRSPLSVCTRDCTSTCVCDWYAVVMCHCLCFHICGAGVTASMFLVSSSDGGVTCSLSCGARVQGGEVEAGLAFRERAGGQREEVRPAEPCSSPDVDECCLLSHLCLHGEFFNGLGSFHCHCQSRYTLDATAKICLDEPRPTPPDPAMPSTQYLAHSSVRKPRPEAAETMWTTKPKISTNPALYPDLIWVMFLLSLCASSDFQLSCRASVHLSQGQANASPRANPALRVFLLI